MYFYDETLILVLVFSCLEIQFKIQDLILYYSTSNLKYELTGNLIMLKNDIALLLNAKVHVICTIVNNTFIFAQTKISIAF